MNPFNCVYPGAENYSCRIPFVFQQEFSPRQTPIIQTSTKRKLGRPKGSNKRSKQIQEGGNFTVGHWTIEENKKYHLFLETNNKQFLQSKLRRVEKAFRSMGAFVQTRKPEQCRSHHQKMEKKYGTFLNILRSMRLEHFGSLQEEYVKNELQSFGVSVGHEILPQQLLKQIKVEYNSEENNSSPLLKFEEKEVKMEDIFKNDDFQMKNVFIKKEQE